MEAKEKEASAALETELAQIPNTPLDEVPDGPDASGNVEYRVWGKKRNYAFTPKQHFELGEALGQMDFELAAKLSGARFVVLQKGLARLERALGQFMLDVHTSEKGGYTEVNPPVLVQRRCDVRHAQLPKFRRSVRDPTGFRAKAIRDSHRSEARNVSENLVDCFGSSRPPKSR